MQTGKIIILCGPSGSGKTTLAQHAIKNIPGLAFSTSATTRAMRAGETDGIDYHFISADEFRKRIDNGEFIEWEEVYKGTYYGTLTAEIERLWSEKLTPVLDIDVEGALNIKKIYSSQVLALFIHPVNIENIKSRLEQRATETEESYEKRVKRAAEELEYAPRLDKVVYNDDILAAKKNVMDIILDFLNTSLKN